MGRSRKGKSTGKEEQQGVGRSRKGKSTGKEEQEGVEKTSIIDLPIDISLNILQRLPIESFKSLRSVCRDFYRLASHPDLVLHYHHLHENPYGLIVRILSSNIYEPYYTKQLYLLDSRKVLTKIIQPRMEKNYNPGPVLSCNGLLCLLFYKHNPPGSDYYRACLFNPLTGEHYFLPDLGLPRLRKSIHENIWFDQNFGFGFDVRTKEYKLVRIVGGLQADLFTFGKNDCWISQIDTPFVCPDRSSDVVVGGAIHWLCEVENSTWFDPKSRIILSFDLSEEIFHQTPTPDFYISDFCKISVLGDCLALTTGFHEYLERHEVQIWLLTLKESGVKETWTKEFVIRERSERLYPLFLLNSGNIVMCDDSKSVCCYDPETDRCEGYAKLDQSIAAICHVPSLVSPFL